MYVCKTYSIILNLYSNIIGHSGFTIADGNMDFCYEYKFLSSSIFYFDFFIELCKILVLFNLENYAGFLNNDYLN